MTARAGALAALAIVAVAAGTRPAAAQAWAPREREGDVTFVAQGIDHIGRTNADASFACCLTTNVAFVVDADYGLTNRWSLSAGLPYVFAKYAGEDPLSAGTPDWLKLAPADTCHCVHSSFQDVSFGAHYNLVKVPRSFSLMTSVSTGVPSHAYQYVGEAVVGFDLKELSLSADAAQQLDYFLPGLSIEGRYAYTFVQRVYDIRHDRSNFGFDTGYTLPNGLAGHLILAWQRTHGGLNFPDDITGHPELYDEFHRLLRDDYFHAGAGVSYTFRDWDLSFSFLKTVDGENTHDVHVYTITMGRSFRLLR